MDSLRKVLCKGEFSSMIISWNDSNGPNYQTVGEMLEERADYYDAEDFLSPEDRQLCIDQNSIWTAHWYPHTPVGFCHIHASSFELLQDRLRKIALEE
jgi:hypothetical protein